MLHVLFVVTLLFALAHLFFLFDFDSPASEYIIANACFFGLPADSSAFKLASFPAFVLAFGPLTNGIKHISLKFA
ncbi:MAG: hypothetical protein ABIP54_02260 [Candidatus Andersenbacteria bacterium]